MIHPAAYWRESKHWSKLIGQTGQVVASTMIRVSSPSLQAYAPYSLVIVEFADQRRELMGPPGVEFRPGQKVVGAGGLGFLSTRRGWTSDRGWSDLYVWERL